MTADLVINGKKRHVVMHAPKNGVFYVLDAATGKVLVGEALRADGQLDDGLDKDGKPILNPEANYGKTGEGFNIVPSAGGAHSLAPDGLRPADRVRLHPDQLQQLPATWPRPARRWATSCSRSTSPSIPRIRRRSSRARATTWWPGTR